MERLVYGVDPTHVRRWRPTAERVPYANSGAGVGCVRSERTSTTAYRELTSLLLVLGKCRLTGIRRDQRRIMLIIPCRLSWSAAPYWAIEDQLCARRRAHRRPIRG